MQIRTFPHEFMARWGRDGKLQGYHVITVDIACDDAGAPLKKDPSNPASENLMETFSEASTLERAGISLDELLGKMHEAALVQADHLTEQASDLKGQVRDLEEALSAAKASATAAQAQPIPKPALGWWKRTIGRILGIL